MRNELRFLTSILAVLLVGGHLCQGQRDIIPKKVVSILAGEDQPSLQRGHGRAGTARGTLNDVRVTPATPGADICAKIGTAIAGLPPTGGTVDATFFTGMQACSSNPFSGVAIPVTLLLGNVTVQSSASWAIASSAIQMWGMGMSQTTLQYTGTTPVAAFVKISTATPTTAFIQNIDIRDMMIRGSAKVTDTLYLAGTHRSVFERLALKDATNACLHTQFAVVNTYYRITCASQDGVGFIQQPAIGLLFDQISPDFPTTDSTVIDTIVEGVSGSGIKLTGAFGMTFTSGTSEENQRGVEITNLGTNNRNTFIGIDLEANTAEDVLDNASYSTYVNVLAASQFHLGATSVNASIRGGQFGNILIDAGASFASFESLVYNLGGKQSITDNGAGTRWKSIANANVPGSIEERDGGWSYRDTVPSVDAGGISSAVDQQDMLRGTFAFGASASVISTTPLGTGPWRVLFVGAWMNAYDGVGLTMPPFITECTQASPAITVGSVTATCGTNGSHQLTLASSGLQIAFTGTIFVTANTTARAGTASAQFQGTVKAAEVLTGSAGLSINGGTALTGQTGTGSNVVTGNSPTIGGTSQYGRLRANQGTALSSGDFSLSAGWGISASIRSVAGTDSGFVLVVSSAGTGRSANPTVTLKYHDGSYGGRGTVPVCTRGDTNSPVTATWSATNTSSAALTLAFIGTPASGANYQVNCAVLGR